MSYILEALKKAEKERSRGKTPSPPVPQRISSGPKKRPSWVYLFLAVILLNAGLLLLWTKPWQPQKTESPLHGEAKQQAAQKTTEAAAARQGRGADASIMQATTTGERPTDKDSLNFPVIPSPPVQGPVTDQPSGQYLPSKKGAASQKTQTLHELPPSVQGSIAEITISGHYYDTDPSSRVATVNGRVMHEGQTLSAGLKIEQITPSGVVFTYQGYRFHKGVF